MSQEDNENTGIDLEDFLELFLLDSQEQVERLGSGLLQLEKDGENIALINELFRCAHSLKGASGTMGFQPIVELTHAAEDLLDKLRQGNIMATNEIVDVLLAVTDKLKEMLVQVSIHSDIARDYGGLTSQMKVLAETGAMTEELLAGNKEENNYGKLAWEDFLTAAEQELLKDEISAGKAVYQIEVEFVPQTQMKAVRAIMITQRLEPLGTIIQIVPAAEQIEAADPDGFNLLFVTQESAEEIKNEILEVSEISRVFVNHYENAKLKEADWPAKTAQAGEQKTRQGKQLAEDQKQDAGNARIHTIRVDTARMDNLINLVGEMVITRTRLVKIGNDLKELYQTDPLVSNLNETNVYLGRLMSELQESVMRLRMVPIGTVFNRYPRLVRDLSRRTGKKIDLIIKGEETELDKTVTEMIGDPIMHLLRNSIDHGIELPEDRAASGKSEAGVITLDAYHEGNHIAIIVSDDGSGLDLEKIFKKALAKGLISEKEEMSEKDIANLILLPGFSTADQVTDISGRGVGMDVVKKALNSLGGLIDIKTKKGEGTSFAIRLPLTLAIIQALLVKVGGQIFAVPLSSVIETLRVKNREIKTVGGLPMVQLRGNSLPLVSLKKKFELPEDDQRKDEVFVVVVGLGDNAVGLMVDELQGQQEIVIKSLGDFLNGLPGIAGATILGDGQVTLILDIGSLIQDIMIAR